MTPSIAKETLLIRFIHYVDSFMIKIGDGQNEDVPKYIEMLNKIDKSKTIIFDTNGPQIVTQNENILDIQADNDVYIRYCDEKTQSNDILINYKNIEKLPKNAIINIDLGNIVLQAIQTEKDKIRCKVIKGGTLGISKTVNFEDFLPTLPIITQKDKKDILMALDMGIMIFAVSFIRNQEDIDYIKDYIRSVSPNKQEIKIISKIQAKQALSNISNIIEKSDGIMICKDELLAFLSENKLNKTIKQIMQDCNEKGKPVFISTNLLQTDDLSLNKKKVTKLLHERFDGMLLQNEIESSENPINLIGDLHDMISDYEETKEQEIKIIKKDNLPPPEQIILSGYEKSFEKDIKIIITTTKNGKSCQILSSLRPSVPTIVFTKDDTIYNFINLLRGVKGYKISTILDYQIVKKIGKEMIKLIFRGGMALTDKILIINLIPIQSAPQDNLQIYNFKEL